MASLDISPPTGLLDLPAEIRVQIYQYAIPNEIVVKEWPASDSEQGFHELQLAEHERPSFMLANTLIHRESSNIFWERVVLDRTLLDTKSWISRPLDASPTSEPRSKIYLSNDHMQQLQHVKVNILADDSEVKWLLSLSNLKTITLFLTGRCVLESDFLAVCSRLRNRLNTRKVQYDLHMWMQEYFRNVSSNLTQYEGVATSIPLLAENHSVQIQLAPRQASQSWNRLVAWGVVEDVKHQSTLRLRYDWNQDLTMSDFDDITTTITPSMDIDQSAWRTDMPWSHGNVDCFPKIYRCAGEFISMKSRSIIERLMFRELENKGIVPVFSNNRV